MATQTSSTMQSNNAIGPHRVTGAVSYTGVDGHGEDVVEAMTALGGASFPSWPRSPLFLRQIFEDGFYNERRVRQSGFIPSPIARPGPARCGRSPTAFPSPRPASGRRGNIHREMV